eukprot:4715460-Amphidinium_carterae.1
MAPKTLNKHMIFLGIILGTLGLGRGGGRSSISKRWSGKFCSGSGVTMRCCRLSTELWIYRRIIPVSLNEAKG